MLRSSLIRDKTKGVKKMAVPVIQLENGRKLSDMEAKQIFEQGVKTNAELRKILAVIHQFNDSEAGVEFLAANQLEYVSAINELTFVTKLVAKIGDSLINYQVNTKDEASNEVVMGALLNEKGKITSLYTEQGEIKTTLAEYEGEFEKDFAEGLPDNEGYVAGQSLKSIDPQWSFADNVCYPGYNHCGSGCDSDNTFIVLYKLIFYKHFITPPPKKLS
jgi:hemoglobin-like flavoprotein